MDYNKMSNAFSFLSINQTFDKQRSLQQQQPRQPAPTDLVKAVFDYFITTKTLAVFFAKAKDLSRLSTCARSFLPFRRQFDLLDAAFHVLITTKTLADFLPRAKDLCPLSTCATSFLPFRCQVRKLEIPEEALTAGLLKHMESGGFADVTEIYFQGYLSLVSISENVKRRLRSTSGALSSLTSFRSENFAISLLDDFPPSVRAQLNYLNVDSFAAPATSLGLLFQGSPELRSLHLHTREGMVTVEALAAALETGRLKNLQTLGFHVSWYFGAARTYLPVILAPIKQGHAPNLKELYLNVSLNDEDIDVLLEFFPFLSRLVLFAPGLSQGGKTRLRAAAENYPGLTMWVF
jgi:hypothetical protein